MTQVIPLSSKLSLPIDLVTMTIGLIGKKGSGKTYGALRLFELFYGAGVQCIAIDPVGLWYGLRLDASGKRESNIVCPIFGGERADVPLQEQSGKIVARFLQQTGSSAILDVSGFSKSKRKQFVADFIETFYNMQKTRRTPVHLFFDEAQLFAPQHPGEGEQRMLGAVEDMVRLGRNFGIGTTLISQRPQSINKEVLNQAEPLILFQLVGAHERKAIADWVTYTGADVKETLSVLPSLQPGNGLFWSPSWANRFEPLRFSKRETYDSTATPVVGDVRRKVALLKPADLGNLTEEIQKMVEETAANDPVKLKAEVASLKQKLALASKGVPEAEVNRRIRDAVAAERKAVVPATLSNTLDHTHTVAIFVELQQWLAKRAKELGVLPVITEYPKGAVSLKVNLSAKGVPPLPGLSPTDRTPPTTPEQKVLNSLAWWESTGAPGPYSRVQVAFIAGYSPTSSGYKNLLSALKTKGMVVYSTGAVSLTDEGRAAAEPVTASASQEELHSKVLQKLSTPQGRVLQPLLNSYPGDVDREALANDAGYSPTSSGYKNLLSSLSTLTLIVKTGHGCVKAADFLFL